MANGFFIEVSIIDYDLEVLAKNPRGSISNTGLASLGIGMFF